MPKFLTFVGRLSWIYVELHQLMVCDSSQASAIAFSSASIGSRAHTKLMVIISPFDFLTFLNFIKKYQNLDLATTVFGANILMR